MTQKRMEELDKLLLYIKEMRKSQEKSHQDFEKEMKKLRESQEKTDKMLSEKFAETDAQMKETDRRIKETEKMLSEKFAETEAQMKKTDERLDKLCKLYGSSENNKGIEVEEFFYRYFNANKKIGTISFDSVNRNIITKNS